MKHRKYYFEILFYVTFMFIKEKKSINNKKIGIAAFMENMTVNSLQE